MSLNVNECQSMSINAAMDLHLGLGSGRNSSVKPPNDFDPFVSLSVFSAR